MTPASIPAAALADVQRQVYWLDRPGAPPLCPPLTSAARADLVVVGGGFTGLWTAIEAKLRDPSCDVVVLEGGRVAHGASGRNGGFISESLTHGLAHGLANWPDEMPTLLRLGRQNIREMAAFIDDLGIDAHLTLTGKTVLAVTNHQVAGLAPSHELHEQMGEQSVLLDRDAVQADVHSPTYRAGLRVRSGSGLLDPVALAWGLLRHALTLGVRVHEDTSVVRIDRSQRGVVANTAHGAVEAKSLVLATNAFPPLLRRLRSYILPVHDHVLVSEPLTPQQISAIGWSESQGLTDAGNQFHYYRRTPDDRILFGGYDAIYYFGGRTSPELEQRESSFQLLASHFFSTFPQLEDLRFTHRWAGVIDTTSRFTPVFGTAYEGRVAYAVGYTGLGVGASRFGAQVALDLLSGIETERTALGMVQQRAVPFPPEPMRYPIVQATRAALAREDVSGRRGVWLSLLDRFGVGFTS